jgi:hypothetical protein
MSFTGLAGQPWASASLANEPAKSAAISPKATNIRLCIVSSSLVFEKVYLRR